MEVILEKFTKYFRSVLHHNQKYFLHFCVIEILNILLVYFNFWLTDWFLQYRFRYYGWQWVVYMMMSKAEKGGADILFLKHACSILRQWSNPV